MADSSQQMSMIGKQNKVIGTALKINGLNGDPHRAMDIGEKMFIVAEISVKGVEFDEKPVGVIRVHKAKIWNYAEMDAATAKEILAVQAENARRAADEAAGVSPLFSGFDDGTSSEPDDEDDE